MAAGLRGGAVAEAEARCDCPIMGVLNLDVVCTAKLVSVEAPIAA